MSVLVYTESEEGKFKKTALEVASYGKAVADQMGTTVTAITFNANDTSVLGIHGVDKVLKINNSDLEQFNANAYASAIAQAAKQEGAKVVVISSSADSKYLAPLLAIDLDAGYASNVVEAPSSASPFTVKRTAFTNKAFNNTTIDTDVKLVGVSKNAFGVHENSASASAEDFSVNIPEKGVQVESIDKVTGKVTIADAEVVVSGGRGLKGPENWGMIEELADVFMCI